MKKNQVKRYLGWGLFYLFLLGLLTANCFGYLDPDFGWHLRVGKNIALNHSVPHDQVYMWTLIKQTWVDHEWLANLIIYKLWSWGGYLLVSSFFILLPLIGLIILNKYLFKNYLTKNSDRWLLAGLEIFGLFCCLPHFGVRVQEITFLFSIITLTIVDSCRRTKKINLALWLIPLIFVWTCLHGGFLFGLAIIIGWLIYELLIKYFPKFKNFYQETSLDNKKTFLLTLIIILSLISTFLTPYGAKLYSFLSDYGSNRYYMSHIEEWRSPYTIHLKYDQIFYSIIIVVLIIAAKTYKKNRLALWKIILSLGLLILASRSVRHFPLWFAGSIILLAPTAIQQITKEISLPYKNGLKLAIIGCLLLVTIFTFAKIKIVTEPFKQFCSYYPCGAVQFLKNHPEYNQLKLFNNYAWGGFMIGVWPERTLFIDGRLPQYPYQQQTILEEYNDFFDKNKLEKKLTEHNIQLILFKPAENDFQPDKFEQLFFNVQPKKNNNPLIDYLKDNPAWKKIYQDKISIIYLKK